MSVARPAVSWPATSMMSSQQRPSRGRGCHRRNRCNHYLLRCPQLHPGSPTRQLQLPRQRRWLLQPNCDRVEVAQGETVVTDFALTPIVAVLEYSPSSYERTVVLGQVLTNSVTLDNSGTIAFDFELSDVGTGAPQFVAPVTSCPEDAYGYSCTNSNEPGGPAYNFRASPAQIRSS